MLTLEPELEKTLEAMAKQEHITPSEIIKRLIAQYLKQKQDSVLLVDFIKELPEFPSFANQDPLTLQKAWRDEWD